MKKITKNVNKDRIFNDEPKVRVDLSTWLTQHTNYISSDIGQIIPIYCDEVLPDEKRGIKMAMTSHTSTPVAPIFNSIYTEIRVFACPMRLCADLLAGYKTRKSPFVKVFGEDNASANSQVIVPLANQKLPDFGTVSGFIPELRTYLNSVSDENNIINALDFDIELTNSISNDNSALAKSNYLTLAAYELIYQRHYRNENFQPATSSDLYRFLFDAYNQNRGNVGLSSSFKYEIANREKDYFTGMKPFTLKGTPVSINVGTSADIKFKLNSGTFGDQVQRLVVGNPESPLSDTINFSNPLKSGVQLTSDIDGTTTMGKLYADLTTAQGLSIEELRLLIKTQELLEKDAIYGSLYAESLNAHFGTCPLDETLQDPAELNKVTITSNMQAIFQTSSTSGESSILGTIGANSTTMTDPFVILPERKFKEHTILMVCAVHKLQNVYDTRYFKPKLNFKKSRFDFYTPELNELGYQPVSNDEMRKSSNAVAGYNEAFAEYRYKFNKVHGRLPEDFPYWAPAIADEYSSASALYKEDPIILDKALSVDSSNAPQFYDAYGFVETNTKPMSLHSIPGMDGVI